MTLDTNDLRVLLGDRAATVTSVPDFVTSAARGGRRIQRRRATSVVVAAAVIVAAVLGITQLGGASHRAAIPATSNGFAIYSHGMKLVKGEQGGSPLTFDVTLPATPDDKPVAVGVSLSCAAPTATDANETDTELAVSINGEQQGSTGGCSKTFPVTSAVAISWEPKGTGYAPGSILHVRVGLTGKPVADAKVRVGVYSAVPLDQYVFPPRPSQLTPVTTTDLSGQGAVLGTINAEGRTRLTVRPEHGLVFNTTASEPGHLGVYLNGKLVDTTYSWTYNEEGTFGSALSLKELGLKAGQAATVSVVPTGYTGPTWIVSIVDRATN